MVILWVIHNNNCITMYSCTWDGVIVNGGEGPQCALSQLSELAASKITIITLKLSNENLHIFIIRKTKHL